MTTENESAPSLESISLPAPDAPEVHVAKKAKPSPRKRPLTSQGIKLGRLNLKEEAYKDIRDGIKRAAESVASSIAGSLEAGYIVDELRQKYPGLGLGEIAEMLKQTKQSLRAARLSQLGKIARYVPRDLLVAGKTAEDYYAVVRYCDKFAKLHEPQRSSRQLEPTARKMVKEAIQLLRRRGRGELTRRLKAEAAKLQEPTIRKLVAEPVAFEFVPGWTIVRQASLPVLLASMDAQSVHLVISTVSTFSTVPMKSIVRVLHARGRIELRAHIGGPKEIAAAFCDPERTILVATGKLAGMVVRNEPPT